jgi:hypothetical protein
LEQFVCVIVNRIRQEAIDVMVRMLIIVERENTILVTFTVSDYIALGPSAVVRNDDQTRGLHFDNADAKVLSSHAVQPDAGRAHHILDNFKRLVHDEPNPVCDAQTLGVDLELLHPVQIVIVPGPSG